MFNRRILMLIALWALIFGTLWWTWQNPKGESLQAEQSGISAARFTQDLSGTWDQFFSLRQAWTTETERMAGKNGQSFLTAGRPISLPSSERFSVVAKRLRVPGEWSSRTMLLTVNGVQGHATVYLNGFSNSEKIGEFNGSGGADVLEIPAKSFRYGEDNILLVELSGGAEQLDMFLGSAWPESGQIKGDIRLDAVVETSLMPPVVSVAWQGTTAQVTVKTNLQHLGFSLEGPWTVYGVLSDGSASVAEQTQIVQAQANVDQQPVELKFVVPDARRWTTQAPYLYQLHLTVTNGKGDLDDLAFPLGLRSIALSSGKWTVNDQVIAIKGEALTLQEEYQLRHTGQIEAWLKAEQKKGINLVYFIGQLPDELWLQAADRVGMGLWAELPVEVTPSSRLPEADAFQKVIAEKMLHPSLWAWTVGKGLDTDLRAQTYLGQVAQEVQPDLAFALTTTPSPQTGLSAQQSLYIQGSKLQGTWGQVTVETPLPASGSWFKESLAAEIWALVIIFLAWMNLRSVTWRYKEIGEKKPKRRLRNAWFWDGLSVLAREFTWAGLITSGLYRLPIHSNPWFSHLWSGIELLQTQSPWLIWAMLGVSFTLIRLLQVGVAAPHLPDAPHTLGLVFWLERRYRWAVFMGIGWASLTWGLPFYIPFLGYIGLVCLFLPLRIRDIHRIGGSYLPFLWVPGIMMGSLLVWTAFHLADWIYLWHMLKP